MLAPCIDTLQNSSIVMGDNENCWFLPGINEQFVKIGYGEVWFTVTISRCAQTFP